MSHAGNDAPPPLVDNTSRHNHQPPKALHTRILQLLLSHLGLFILVSFVAAFGAWIFMQIEQPYEDETFRVLSLKIQDLRDSREYFIGFLWHLGDQNITHRMWKKQIQQQLLIMEDFTLDMAHNYGYDGSEGGWSYSWNFPNALLFTVSIMTTIGYGHISPRTTEGQLFTILYAMIGTPLLLVFLANIGDGMAKAFTFTYSRICCRWCRSARYKAQRNPGKRAKRVSEDVVGKEEYMPTDNVNVPITINLMLIALYLGLGAVIFHRWEEWEVTTAYYFSFVTLSTIGFGDYVPGKSFLGRSSDGAKRDETTDDRTFAGATIKMLITVSYCLIGMALISMCIQIMQEQIIDKVHWAGQELGLVQDKNKPQLHMRRTRRHAAPETSNYEVTNADIRRASAKERRRKQKREEADEVKRRPEQDEDQGDAGRQQHPAGNGQNQRQNQQQQQQSQQDKKQQQQQQQQRGAGKEPADGGDDDGYDDIFNFA